MGAGYVSSYVVFTIRAPFHLGWAQLRYGKIIGTEKSVGRGIPHATIAREKMGLCVCSIVAMGHYQPILKKAALIRCPSHRMASNVTDLVPGVGLPKQSSKLARKNA